MTRADKGQVLRNKSDYQTAADNLLADKNTYLEEEKDNNDRLQKINNHLINRWYALKYISESLKNELIVKTTTSPRLYILPKIHKTPLSFRPIVSSINGPLHRLARFTQDRLTKLTNGHFSQVKNSFEFKEHIKNVRVPPGYILVSLDVTSLFTNVPLDLVKKAIEDNKDKLTGNIPFFEILKSVEIIMNNTFFQFNSKF